MTMAEVLKGVVDKVKAGITDEVDLILVIVGVGGSAAIAEVVKTWFPEQTADMGDETIVAIVGFLLFYFGDRLHARVVPLGIGVFLAGVGAMSEELVAGAFEMLKKKE